MKHNFEYTLEKFEDVLKHQFPDLHEKLVPPTNEYEGALLGENLKFQDEYKILYNWHNGVYGITEENITNLSFFSFGIFLPFEIALWTYVNVTTSVCELSENLFPVFSSTVGDDYLIDINIHSRTYGNIFFYSPSLLIIEPITIFESLETLFESLLEGYSTGCYEYNIESGLAIESKIERAIFKKNNPVAEYWKSDTIT
jgi:hypothetical protein